jgi:hypothetical protein
LGRAEAVKVVPELMTVVVTPGSIGPEKPKSRHQDRGAGTRETGDVSSCYRS